MKSWVIAGDLLEIADGNQRIPASADQVYASIIENQPVWDDLPSGESGDAAGLKYFTLPGRFGGGAAGGCDL